MGPAIKRKWKIGCGVVALLLFFVAVFTLNAGYRLTKQAFIVPEVNRRITLTPGDALGPGTIPISFINEEDDLVPGWYHPGELPGAIVLLHGLGGTRTQLTQIARELNDDGWGVLLIDQHGHGEHPANFTTFGRAELWDALAAVRWLRDRPEIDPDRIGLFGASMGATTCIYAAAEDPNIACAVADSSYADIEQQAYHDLGTNKAGISVPKWLQPSVVKIFLLYSPLIIGKWAEYPNPVDVVDRIKCPLFLIHGEHDERIDIECLNDLSKAAKDAGVDVTTWMVRDKGHCAYHRTDEFKNRLSAFFRRHL